MKQGFDSNRTQRSPYSQQAIRRIFAAHKIKCLECGICCTNPRGPSSIGVHRDDPNRRAIKRAAKRQKKGLLVEADIGFLVVSQGSRCTFGEQKGSQYVCDIYEQRPFICRIFPFNLELVDSCQTSGPDRGRFFKRNLLVLTSSCPLVKEAKGEGVSYVSSEDLFGVEMIDGNIAIKSLEVPLLSECLFLALQHATQGKIITFEQLTAREVDGRTEIIVPVF